MGSTTCETYEKLVKHLKTILNIQHRWADVVYKSDELFTTLAHNLMREQRLIDIGGRDENAWSVKWIPKYPSASVTFLEGDFEGATKMAAALKIEADFDALEDLLREIAECLQQFQKLTNQLLALQTVYQKVGSALQSPSTSSSFQSPSGRKREQKLQKEGELCNLFSWSALISECRALQIRLQEDLEFRRGLLRYIPVCVINSSIGEGGVGEGDFGAPQRVCFFWRQAERVVYWENCTGLMQQLISR